MLFPVSAGTHSCPDYLCCHSVIFPTLSVVCFLPGNGDKRLQGLLYFLLSHNVFFPYFVVYSVPGNGDKQLQGPFYFLLSHNVFFPYFIDHGIVIYSYKDCFTSCYHTIYFSLLHSSWLAWEWWYTATRTARRTCRPGSTTLSSPWSWQVRWGRGAGRPSSPSRSTSSTVAVSALSCGFGAYSCSWDLGRFHRI